MAYADDVALFSTNVLSLQYMIDICTKYSKKSKCMIIGKSRFSYEPTWRLNDCILNYINNLYILGNVFNQYGNSYEHVNNTIAKSRQSFYGLNSAGITYRVASPAVQACIYECIWQSTLTYGLECMQMR